MLLNLPFIELRRSEFLKDAGWRGATETSVGEDWSQRKFFRIQRDNKSAILMQSVPDDDPKSTPGHKLRDFVTVSKYLKWIEVSAPQVYSQDLEHGFLLVEDFGVQDFASRIMKGGKEEIDSYVLATNALRHIYKKTDFMAVTLPNYYDGHIHTARRRVVDWYMPVTLGRINHEGAVHDYLHIWNEIEKTLPPVQKRFLHGDFHPANLMWLPERQDILQVGLIDFQGAMVGPAPYDLVNLLEDARRLVPDDIRLDCMQRYVDGMKPEEKESFLAWYPVLAAQFHCRVIGQALKLAINDQKFRLLELVPILRRHIMRDLAHPVLRPLKDWFAKQGVDFSTEKPISIDGAEKFIRVDAF